MKRIKPSALALLSLGVLLSTSCFYNIPHYHSAPEVLRVGVIPDRSAEALEQAYRPLLEHVSQRVGVPYTLIIPESYDDLLARFRRDEFDLAYFGGLGFVKAAKSGGAVPLVIRDVDAFFESYLLIRAEHPAQKLEDCRGLRFAFGPRLSTSGHLMPRHFMQQQAINPERFFSEVRYSTRHDLTALAVRDGEVDVGSVNAEIAEAMYAAGTLDPEQVRILWETPPYVDNVWVVHDRLPTELFDALRDAFLELSAGDPTHEQILRGLGAEFFLPAHEEDFGTLRQIAAAQQSAD